MSTAIKRTAVLILLQFAWLTGCERTPATTTAERNDHAGHDHAAPDDHAGHDHAEASDLDQAADALFAAECEHGTKTFACEECRYEVGVARAPQSLFEGGLLHATTPRREAVPSSLELTGEVRFDDRRVAHLASAADGVVREVAVALGDRVRRGAPLVTIESGAAGEAQAAYREAQSLLRLATSNHERAAMLREREISSRKDWLAAEQELEAARIRVESAAARLAQLGAAADDPGGRLVLRAPVDGTVLALHAVPGELAGPGEALVTVGDNAVVWVWADVYERDLARVGGSHPQAAVTVHAYPGETFPGIVDLVSPAMDEASRTAKVRVVVDNPQGRLLAGMFATVNVQLPGDDQALTLPRDAVLEDEGRAFVFVRHHDDYFIRRPITTGRAWADRIEVAGLTGDETVVADGAFLLKSDVLRSKMGAGCAD